MSYQLSHHTCDSLVGNSLFQQDEGYYAGRVAANTKNWKKTLGKFDQICPTSGVGPFLTGGAAHNKCVCPHRDCSKSPQRPQRAREASPVWNGPWRSHGHWKGDCIGLWGNPTKVTGSKKLLPRLQKNYNGWGKEAPLTTKQLRVEADVPKLQAEKGCGGSVTELKRAMGDLSLITFYYLFCIGEYTVKGTHNATKKTIQFNYEDITFFKKIHLDSYDNSQGMRQHTSLLPRTTG
jgi:hypothetical protein